MIKIENLCKSYKRRKLNANIKNCFGIFSKNEDIPAVKNITLSIERGERVALCGANGAGKSTLIKMMIGLIEPTRGNITINGNKPFKRNKLYLRQIGVVLGQKQQLIPDLTPKDTFELHKRIYKLSDKDYKNQLNTLVDLLNVRKVLDTQVRLLSLGERIKCELIVSLLHRPNIIFLDEPTIGLDYKSQIAIRNFINKYTGENEATLLLISHCWDDINSTCNRLLYMNNGEVVVDKKINDLFKDIKELRKLKISTASNVLDDVRVRNLCKNIRLEQEQIVCIVEEKYIGKLLSIVASSSIIREHVVESLNIFDVMELRGNI
ncbi:ATP-binding cassette domain-containing protein [Paramaledivibacter caminithermalis]|jgi:ABC-2 type transport system ATP-binding protein|uniref:ABC-2 type transport system ATP-binding protein n=1 Tax=Paramaledivibacter caminithermalis (strain DSM 15212 / CIP 107654 / DViRD3) TaxID=1121301 RepID=A0A1M6R053_PARC5|nr:ATP-binding cassette domain-containing protein [Paramaledivibacter caminithermalis]SHK25718.1 ABC-2 type transport system ATP-binding protein [Paramaledivibacter caminithermalis DSM 15212]